MKPCSYLDNIANPWANGIPPHAPFLLAADQNVIELHNHKFANQPEFQIHTEAMPEPFIGDPNAPLVVLNLNPKWDGTGLAEPFISACRSNWNQQPRNPEYPFYYFDPELQEHGGYRWWRQKLGALMPEGEQIGNEDGIRRLAQRIFAIEYCGYPSAKFNLCEPLQGDPYRNALVKCAIERNATIIIMQGARLWYDAIPELSNYQISGRLFEIKSPQNSSIGTATLCRPVGDNDIGEIKSLL